MGNTCCPNQYESRYAGKKPTKRGSEVTVQTVTLRARTNFSAQINGLKVVVKVGDITKEKADAIVSGTDNYMKNRSASFVDESTSAMLIQEVSNYRGAAADEPMKNGEVVITGPAGFQNVQHIIHLAVPVWRGGHYQEVNELETGFFNVLKEAARNSLQSIIVTDISSSLFGIPKQYTASALINAIKRFGDSNKLEERGQLHTVKIVHKNELTVGIFENALKIEAGLSSEFAMSLNADKIEGAGGSNIPIVS